MKKVLLALLSAALILTLALFVTACNNGSDDAGTDSQEETAQTETEEPEETGPSAVQSITDIDTEDMNDIPLQIESITLFDDGTVALVPLEDLKRNAESNNELKEDGAMYPFADIGKVKELYLVRFGNGGYRTIIALMDDGTLSAMSAKELIDDHIVVVMPNMTGRDNYVSVEQTQDEFAFGVIGKTEDGEEIELDFSLDF
ncbi:MAG: hypothetical protein IJH92_06485 [Mogibacterium sp.]|nr:hypothetical protein [Mogibacterium sp.]